MQVWPEVIFCKGTQTCRVHSSFDCDHYSHSVDSKHPHCHSVDFESLRLCCFMSSFFLKGRDNHFNILNWLCQQPHLPAAADASTSHTPTTTAASATVPCLTAPLGTLLHHHLPHRQSLDLPWPVHHLRHAAPETTQLGKVQQRAGRAVFWTGKGSVD